MSWISLADTLERKQRDEEALDRDEHDLEVIIERLLENGRVSKVQDVCEDALRAIGKTIT